MRKDLEKVSLNFVGYGYLLKYYTLEFTLLSIIPVYPFPLSLPSDIATTVGEDVFGNFCLFDTKMTFTHNPNTFADTLNTIDH